MSTVNCSLTYCRRGFGANGVHVEGCHGRGRVRVHVHVARVKPLDTECTWRPTSMLRVFYAYDLLVELVTDYTVVVFV